jgi:hypothetical protein
MQTLTKKILMIAYIMYTGTNLEPYLKHTCQFLEHIVVFCPQL